MKSKMKAVCPFRAPVARRYYSVAFTYGYLDRRIRYDAESDEIGYEEVPVTSPECSVRVLAATADEAAEIVSLGALSGVRPGTRDADGHPVEHKTIEGTVRIERITEWEPRALPGGSKKKEAPPWQ